MFSYVSAPSGRLSYLVDLKGIEPSNLTDANRALSQLSYKPISIFFGSLSRALCIISQIFHL